MSFLCGVTAVYIMYILCAFFSYVPPPLPHPLPRSLRMQQIDFEESLVDERDEAITDIAQAINEVNETFRDLAQIVEDQGKDIDTIEVNVVSAESRTAEGVGHLESAEKSQKGYRKWLLVLFVLILIIAAVIGGVVYDKSKK